MFTEEEEDSDESEDESDDEEKAVGLLGKRKAKDAPVATITPNKKPKSSATEESK